MSECNELGCQGCPFKSKRIGPKGPLDSPFVIVGESPGSRELAAGIPFVGPSGQLLEKVLNEAGLRETGIVPYITNALSCYPSDKTVPIMKKAAHSCRQRLLDEIQLYPRKVILCLGAAASWSVTGDFTIAITRDRGKIIQSPLAEDGVVLAVHPAFLLRNGSGYPMWRDDVSKAVKTLAGLKQPEFIPPTWRVIDSRIKLYELTKEYATRPFITGDVETDSLDAHTGRMLMLGITHDGNQVDIIPEEVLYNNWDLTTRLVENEARWNWHNGKFDIRWFMRHGAKAHVDEDTMLLSYALNENRGVHDLDQTAQYYIGAPNHKNVLDKYLPNKKTSYRVIPPEILYKYAAYDIAKTHRQWFPMHKLVAADPALFKAYSRLLIPGTQFCADTEAYGVKVSLAAVVENEVAHQQELKELDTQIQQYAIEYTGGIINIGSTKQLAELLYDRMGLVIPGERGTSEPVLIDIQRKYNHPIIDILLKWREVQKRCSTYVTNLPPKIHPDGRIRLSFLLHGTTSGRLAARDPNLLNQPRGKLIRSQYVASPGKIFVEVDLNQAELRSLATMSKDALLVQIYTENKISIHDVTTAAFFGSKADMAAHPHILEKAQRQLLMGPQTTPDEVYKEAKMAGKAVNFGIVYGREAGSMAKEFNLPMATCQHWIDTWFKTYPDAHAFIKQCRAAVAMNKTLTTIFGRRKRFGVVTTDNIIGLQNEAANFPHQSTAADIMLETAIEVRPELVKRWDAHIWLELYDAIYFEVDDDIQKIAEAVEYVQRVITEVPRRHGLNIVPFIGDAKIGYDWGHMYDYHNDGQYPKDLKDYRHTEAEEAEAKEYLARKAAYDLAHPKKKYVAKKKTKT